MTQSVIANGKKSAHSNPISCIRVYKGQQAEIQGKFAFSTSDVNGDINFWAI